MGVDRRAFLRTGLSVAAAAMGGVTHAAGTVQQPASRTPATARRIRLSLKWGMIESSGSVLERFEIIQRAGYDGVEIDSPSDLNLEDVIAASKKTGIIVEGVVDSVHWSQTLSSSDAAVRGRGVDALRHALKDCAKVGGTTVLLVPAVVNAGTSYADAYQRSQEEIRKVLPRASELGVKIAIENVWNKFLLSPLEAARYIDEFESEWIGWHFDIGNIVNDGWPEQWIRILDKRILKLDVKEFSRKKRDNEGLWKGFDCEIGEGDIDWKAVRAALRDIGYDDGKNWAAAEVGGGNELRLKEIRERMDASLNTMNSEE